MKMMQTHAVKPVDTEHSAYFVKKNTLNAGCLLHENSAKRSAPGIEPGTSSTLRKNHTPRPSRQVLWLASIYISIPCCVISRASLTYRMVPYSLLPRLLSPL